MHIFCHDVTAYGCRRTEHDENRHQLTATEAEKNGKREKDGRNDDQFNQGGHQTRFDLCQSLPSFKGRAYDEKGNRRSCGRDICNKLQRYLRNGNTADGKNRADQDTDDDRIFNDVDAGPADRFGDRFILSIGGAEGEDDDGENIVKGHGGDNHHRRHPGISVNIFHKGDTENRCAAPGGGLSKGAGHGFVFTVPPGKEPDTEKHQRRSDGAEENEFQAEHFTDICCGNILKT